VRRGLAKSGTKADLLARLQLNESQQYFGGDGIESDIEEEFAALDLELGTPIPDTPIPQSPMPQSPIPEMYEIPED
jgi:hypothetical protein